MYDELIAKGWPEVTVLYLRSFLEKLMDEDFLSEDCVDNYRFARSAMPKEVLEYEELRAGGCCGFLDTSFRFGGQDILVGFNYGH